MFLFDYLSLWFSFCNEHLWRASPYVPGKKSVFALDDFDDIEDEAAGDDDSEGSGDELKGREETGDEVSGPDDSHHNVLENEHFERASAEGLLRHTCRDGGENGKCFGLQGDNLHAINNEQASTREACEQTQNYENKHSQNTSLTIVSDQSCTTKKHELHRDIFKEDNNCIEQDVTVASLANCVLSNREGDIPEVDNPESGLDNHKKLSNCSVLSIKDSDKTGNCKETFCCHCLECDFPGDWTCLHSFLSSEKVCGKTTCVSNLASCAELSTYFECFEVVSDEQYAELEKCSHCCPLDNANRSKSRKSNSSTKGTKKGKPEKTLKFILCFK